MAQSVGRLTSAHVMISRFMSSSPASGSVPTAQSLEPASDSVSPSLCVPPMLAVCLSVCLSKINKDWGAWVAQSVKRPTSAQVVIPRFASPSPAPGSVLTAQSLEPASDSVSPSLSAPPLLILCLSVSLSLSLSLSQKETFKKRIRPEMCPFTCLVRG